MALTPGFRESFMKLPPTPNISAFAMEMRQQPSGNTKQSPDVSITSAKEHYNRDDYIAVPKIRLLSTCQIVFSVLLLGLGAAVVGCEAHALHMYNSTHLSNQWFLPLWPRHTDLGPTISLIAGGAIIAATSLPALVCSVIPSRARLLTAATVLLSVLGLAGAAFGVGYSAHVYMNTESDTLQSWTCLWTGGASAASVTGMVQTDGITAPSGFARVCNESHAAFDMMVVSLALEGLMLVTVGMGWWVGRKYR